MKLLGSTKDKISKEENSEKVPHLEIIHVVLVQCNIANKDYQQDSRVLYMFFLNKSFYGFLSFDKNMGQNICKNISKNLSGKYSKKLLDHAKQSATGAPKNSKSNIYIHIFIYT